MTRFSTDGTDKSAADRTLLTLPSGIVVGVYGSGYWAGRRRKFPKTHRYVVSDKHFFGNIYAALRFGAEESARISDPATLEAYMRRFEAALKQMHENLKPLLTRAVNKGE